MMIDEKIIMNLLDSKEKRAHRQRELIEKYKNSLICLTLNIPGRVKDSFTYREIHKEGIRTIKDTLKKQALSPIYSEEIENISGREAYIVVKSHAYRLKEIAVNIEETHSLGRLFDIDVFSSKHRQIARGDLGINPRRCLLCDLDARICMRERNHSYEELIQAVNSIWSSYKI